ncbi:hypothetical protein [Mycobacterium phage WXIN]|nr:hypothetical protein [Mycobacterium phage WXIN]
MSGSRSLETMPAQPECKRPTCKRPARPSDAGYCRAHYNAFLKARARRDGYRQGLVDAAPVVEHIAQLRKKGLGLERIAELACVDRRGLQRFVSGHAQRCYGLTAKKVLDVPIPAVPHEVARLGARVDSIGTVRRIRALIAIGYSCTELAKRLDSDTNVVSILSTGRRKQTTAEFASRVEKQFQALQMEIPPESQGSKKAIARARERGWAPPLAWDEDSIDDLRAKPSVPVGFGTAGRMERYELLRGRGLNDSQIAKDLDIHRSTLSRWLQEQREKAA